MAKKKQKLFQKRELISLFEQQKYQKVIAKIKQFTIVGMDAKELQELEEEAYKKLIAVSFSQGDMNRALRDLYALVAMNDAKEYKILLVKYLCYAEKFSEATVLAEELLDTKDITLKKELAFFYLLARLYGGEETLSESYLRYMTPAKKNYLFAFLSIMQGKKEEALSFLSQTKPRLKIEKENVAAIKAIILEANHVCSQAIKPLYKYLLKGESEDLLNTKATRGMQKEYDRYLAQKREEEALEKLLCLEESVEPQIILNQPFEKAQQIKLLYNNIAIMAQNENLKESAAKIFLQHKKSLVTYVESANLYISLKEEGPSSLDDTVSIRFFTDYLELHHKKLSQAQKDYIFMYGYRAFGNKTAETMLLEYGGENIIFLFRDLQTTKEISSDFLQSFDGVFKKYSPIYVKILEEYAHMLKFTGKNLDLMTNDAMIDKEAFIASVSILAQAFSKMKKPHSQYKATLLKLLDGLATAVVTLSFSRHKELYLLSFKALDALDIFFAYKKENNLPHSVINIQESLKANKQVQVSEQKEESMLDVLKRLTGNKDADEDDILKYIFEEEYYYSYEDDFEELLEEENAFEEALQRGDNPIAALDNELKIVHYDAVEFAVRLTHIAKEYEENLQVLFLTLLQQHLLINIEEKPYRDILLKDIFIVKEYEKAFLLELAKYCLLAISNKKREMFWYLQWLYEYVNFAVAHNLEKDSFFQLAVSHFLHVQGKKRYKSLQGKKEQFMRKNSLGLEV